jgi:hypothetical protein
MKKYSYWIPIYGLFLIEGTFKPFEPTDIPFQSYWWIAINSVYQGLSIGVLIFLIGSLIIN